MLCLFTNNNPIFSIQLSVFLYFSYKLRAYVVLKYMTLVILKMKSNQRLAISNGSALYFFLIRKKVFIFRWVGKQVGMIWEEMGQRKP